MPLDFAYRIHTHIGNTTVGAIVNGKIVPLNYKLKTGDVVAIKTNKNTTPSKEWLKHAKTSSARQKINSFINKQKRDELVALGQEEFEKYSNEKERIFGILIKKDSSDYIIGSCDLCGCSIDSAFQEIEVSDLGFYKKLKEIIDAKIIH